MGTKTLHKLQGLIPNFGISGSVKSVMQVIFGNASASLISLVASFLVARWTRPYDMGVWNVALLVAVYAPILQLGVFNGLNRELPYLIGAGRKEQATAMAQTAYYWALILVGISLVASWIVAISFYLKGQVKISHTILALGVVVSTSWASFYYTTTYRTHSEFGRLAKNTTLVAIIGVPLAFLVFQWGYSGLLFRAAALAVLGVLALYLYRPMPVRPSWNKTSFFQMAKVGVPIWLVGQLGAFFISLDRLLLAHTPELLGFFTIAIQVGMFVRNIPIAFTLVLYPQMAHKYGETHNATEIWHIAKNGAILAVILGTFAGILGYLVLPKFVELFLPNYLPGVPAARWASFLGGAMGLYVFDNIYNIIGRQDVYVANWFFGVSLFFVCWHTSTHLLGQSKMIAAAQSMFFATLGMAFLSMVMSYRICRRHDSTLAAPSSKGEEKLGCY